jgi:hypothetical protein
LIRSKTCVTQAARVECSGPLQLYRDSQYAVVQEWRAPSIPHTSVVCGVVSLPRLVQDEIDVNPLFSSSRVLAGGRGADVRLTVWRSASAMAATGGDVFAYHRTVYQPTQADVCCQSRFITVRFLLPTRLPVCACRVCCRVRGVGTRVVRVCGRRSWALAR